MNGGVIDRLGDVFTNISDTYLSPRSLLFLFISLLCAFILGRIIAWLMRKLNRFFSKQADKATHLPTVERWRSVETALVISIAIIRAGLFVAALYLWWIVVHPNEQSAAFLGTSAVLVTVVLAGLFRPLLRDFAAGSMMMAEKWFGVGDLVKIEPFMEMQGVVERVTLRSTRIRDMNGEVIWINNQHISAVRVTRRGSRSLAIELFVNNLEEGIKLLEETNLRLPQGPLMMVTPLRVINSQEVAEDLWHIRALGQTAPSREWLLEKYAIDVIQQLDAKRKKPILASEPIVRAADAESEKRFSRSIRNARKTPVRATITEQLNDVKRHATAAKKSAKAKTHKKNRRLVQ